MSLENDDQNSPYHPDEEPYGKAKISYTREFLLCLSELDVCKKLPSGFDRSILSEFEDASQERQRISGGLSMHNFRRNEYGSSPPNRGDLSNYSRGNHGRWDSRSSGRSDRDNDSQSDRDSDPGRRYVNQSRRSWHVPEHDGLLGSGSNPRPSGFTPGLSNPKFRANDQYQLTKSNEPYHPPRPYKGVPYARRENNDSYNDETFGSSDYTSEDKAEEERKRRTSFELMRKEQLKTFQERQTLTPEKRQDDFDITSLIDNPKEEKKLVDRDSESVHPVIPISSNESARSLIVSAPNSSRPLVPPGFAGTSLEKNLTMRSSGVTSEMEVVHPELGDMQLHAKGDDGLSQTLNNLEKPSAKNINLSEQPHKTSGFEALINSDREKIQDLSADLDAPCKTIGMTLQSSKVSIFPVAMPAPVDSDIIQLEAEVSGSEALGDLNHDRSNSVLKKLLGDDLALEDGTTPDLVKEKKTDEMWNTNTFQSSKFARWFTEEENKPADDSLIVRPNDLLSLIGGSEIGSGQVSDVKSDFVFKNSEAIGGHVNKEPVLCIDGSSEHLYCSDKQEVVSTVITCEDLEQSMLSGISEDGSAVQERAPDGTLNASTELPNANVDNHASQHLLSLLQKGTNKKDLIPSSNVDASSSGVHDAEGGSEHANKSEEETKEVSNLLKTLTLETLFGSAFMKELQSVGAPVSVQRSSSGSVSNDASESPRFPFPVMDNNLLPSTDEIGLKRQGSNVFASNEMQHKTGRTEKQCLGYDEPQTELGASQLRHEFSKLNSQDGSADIRLPEEDSLLAVTDPLQSFISGIDSGQTNVLSSMDRRTNFVDTLAPINTAYIEGRHIMGGQEGQLHPRVPFDMRESDIPFQNFNAQRSSPQVHPSQLNHMGPMFNPLNSHANINPNMKFINADNMIHHGSPPNHFPGSMVRPPFQNPSSGLNGFDGPAHHSMLQQMHVPGNFPPHLVRGFPRSAPMPAHHNNGVTSFMQERNPMQGFPFSHQQPSIGPGMSLPAPETGGRNHPEALQRLIEMELRSNSKPIRHFSGGGGGHAQESYGHELDMGFGYNRI